MLPLQEIKNWNRLLERFVIHSQLKFYTFYCTFFFSVLGTPSEFYIYGTMFWWFALTYTLMAVIVSEIYIPLFYRLKITSTYEVKSLLFTYSIEHNSDFVVLPLVP